TNGVYTVGDQIVEGNKTFTSPIVGNLNGNAATATNANIARSVTRAAQDADVVSPVDGQVYYNTTANVFKVFDNPTSSWKIVDAGTAATLSAGATIGGNQVNGDLTNATIAGNKVTSEVAIATTAVKADGLSASATVPGSQVSGNIPGKATSITDTISGNQVNGPVAEATNATAVTNGVYTVGDQIVEGNKTFTSPIVGNLNGNAATATNANIARSVTRA